MTPLFAATQMPSSSSQVSFGSISLDVTDGGQLRATQNPQFSLTQAEVGISATAQTYDWLNPSSLVSTVLHARVNLLEFVFKVIL